MTVVTDLDILTNPPKEYVWAGWPSLDFELRWESETKTVKASDEQAACSIHMALEAAGSAWKTD